VITLLLMTPQLFAQTCVQEEYNKVTKQKLNCTANDVRVAEVHNVRDPVTGAKISTCTAGATFNFLADFKIVTTSSQARENVGLYIATNSQTTALTGACVDNIISPGHHADGTPCTPGGSTVGCFGSDNYHETDAKPDNCGDTSSGDFSGTFGAGAELVTLEIDNFVCQAPAGTTQVQLPNCTSWQIPGGTIQCQASTTTYAYPFNGPGGTPTAIPGSPSKCNCSTIPLGVTVQTPGIGVGKACRTNDNDVDPTFTLVGTAPNQQLTGSPASCTISPEGGTATYTVDISNTSNFGDVQVTQVCDSAYGQIFPATGTCDAGTECASPNNVTGTGCSTGTTCSGVTIAKGADAKCTFTATQAEAKTVTNIASATVKGVASGTTAGGGSNSVSVISGEAASSATVTKGVNTTTNLCATIRYSVDVKNTSPVDETLTLSAVNDTVFGAITPVAGTPPTLPAGIKGTTCGVPTGSAGLGTLSGSTGGGALSTTLSPTSEYQCLFDAQFCAVPDNSGCITHSNAINATITGDEGEAVTITLVPDPTLNVKVCATTTVVP
jgi:hypothetical protein